MRRFIHAAPINKLFAFGGDHRLAHQRHGLCHAGAPWGFAPRWKPRSPTATLTEKQAVHVASLIMRDNQYDCFDMEGTRANIRAAA